MEKYGRVNPAAGEENSARNNMLEMWKESIERSQQNRQTAPIVEKDEKEKQADLEQRIRNGQAPCPTCAGRTYQDESDDGGVSFQAPKHLAASTSGIRVMSHESEHVGHEHKDTQEKNGDVKNSSVTLEWAKCPECGRTYVKGGLTKTTRRIQKERNPFNGFNAEA